MNTSPRLTPVVWLTFAVWIGAAMGAGAATPWVVRSGQAESQMPAELEKWTGAPYNLQPVCINGYEISGVARFSVLYAKPTEQLAVLTSISVTGSVLTQLNATRQSSGYRLVWLNGFGFGTEARYNAVWKKTNGAPQRLRVGQTLTDHQAEDAAMNNDQYRLSSVSSYNVNGSPFHAAYWTHAPFTFVQDVVYSQTPEQYQAAFNAHPAADGWRLTSVSGYTVSTGAERFTAIFRKVSGPAWWSMHALDSTNFDSANLNAHYTGYRPAFLHTYQLNNTSRSSAIWQHDHGLSPGNSAAIGTAVREYMESRSRPGLSLAITRRGRLIYAAGFGWADQAAGEIVGPRHRFRIASVAKPICAVAVLHALERFPGGLNSLVFGAGALLGTDYGTPPYNDFEEAIRVRHLLNMTSGWTSDGKLWYNAEPSWGSDNGPAIDWQLDGESIGEPGANYHYTNINFVTAARIVEKLSGQTFEDYVKNEVFARCGVSDIAVGNRRKADRQFREVIYYPEVEDQGPYLIDPRRMDGSTAWIAKPMDLLLFARRVDRNNRHVDILTGGSVDAIRTPTAVSDTYGLGWYNNGSEPIRWWGHNGSMAGSAAYLVTRQDGVSWAYAANSRDGGDTYSGEMEGLVNGLIDDLNAADAWPEDEYDLYPHVNNEFDAWRDPHFSGVDRGQPGLQAAVWGFDADPDQDGVPNGAEAYFGRHPNRAEGSPFHILRSGDNVTVRWLRSVEDRGVLPIVEVSGNMQSWFVPLTVTIQPRPDLFTVQGYRWEEITFTATGPRAFYRLRFVPQ